MRLAWLLLLALAGTAHADQKLQSFKPDFVREVTGCKVQVNGLATVLTGATELVKTIEAAERPELERDIEQLTKGIAVEKEYCDEVTAMIAFIDANAAAPYRSIAPELDARYNKIVKLRAASKKNREDLQPTTRKLIPRITRRSQPTSDPRLVASKFPSGRAIELPSLAGTWRLSGSSTTDTADYLEPQPKGPAILASATTRSFSGTTCDQQRKSLLVRSDAEQLADLDLPGAKALGVAWGARYTRREETAAHLVSVLCVPGSSGGLLATADVAPADRSSLVDELGKLLLRMITARKP